MSAAKTMHYTRTLYLGLALLLPCGMTSGVRADVPPAPTSVPGVPGAPAAPADYLLAADDVLGIKVVNFPDLTTEVTVSPDGTITVPLLSPLPVTGRTTTDVARRLARQWDDYVVHPSVSVSLVRKRTQNVLAYGSVARAGTIEYRPQMHILSALAEIGGAGPTGELGAVTVTHPDGTSQTLDLSHPETKGGTDKDIILQAGDVIYVPERHTQFSVVGEVNRPGSFDYKDDETVLGALTEAGGVKDTADLPNATLVHAGTERPLNLDALLNHGDLSINAKLTPGDRILVPELHNRTYVFGAVGRPGYYSFKPGDRVLDALNASTPTQEADLARVNVIHVNKVNNTAVVTPVDINKVLTKGEMQANVLLQVGDILYVPDKRHKIGFTEVLSALSGLSVVSNATRLLTGH